MKYSLAFLLIVSNTALAQMDHNIDSLRHQLMLTKQDTSRVLILVDLSHSYRNTNPDSAIMYGKQALDLAQKIKFLRGQARAFDALGIATVILGDLPKGFAWVFKGLQIAEEYNFPYEASRCLNLLGYFYAAHLGDDIKAMGYFRRSLAMIQKAAISKEKISQEAQVTGNIGSTYLARKHVDSAAYYFYKAIKIQRKANLEITPLQINGLGRIEFMRKNYRKAMQYSHQAIKRCKNTNNHRSASTVYNTLATYYKDLNQPDSAIYYAKIGLVESQSIALKDGLLLNSRLLADLYESKDISKAYEYQKIALKANEELNGLKKIKSLQKTITDELLRQRALEVERIAYQHQLRQYAFLAGLGVLFLIAFILYRTNKQQKKANNLLHRQKEEINHQRDKAEQALTELRATQTQLIQREKMASLGELTAGIAHEIQNPLNFVNNFSELSTELVEELTQEAQAGRIDDVLALAGDICQNLQKITHHGQRASSIVKGMLEHSRTSNGQKEPTGLNAMVDEYLKLAYQGFRRSGVPAKDKAFNCELITHFELDLSQVEVVPQEIGRVLLNLYNNAFYAVGQKQKTALSNYQPTVWISTAQVNGYAEIRVKDNGIGIPESVKTKIFQPFFTTKPTGEGTGLGLSLSYDIITKGHGGTLEVTTVLEEFTEFIIVLPVR